MLALLLFCLLQRFDIFRYLLHLKHNSINFSRLNWRNSFLWEGFEIEISHTEVSPQNASSPFFYIVEDFFYPFPNLERGGLLKWDFVEKYVLTFYFTELK